MVTSIEISGLRGIREGKIENLPLLGIFVGKNGTGKSTVLEALLIGAHPDPGVALANAVLRRNILNGARWLFHRGDARPIRLAVKGDKGSRDDPAALAAPRAAGPRHPDPFALRQRIEVAS